MSHRRRIIFTRQVVVLCLLGWLVTTTGFFAAQVQAQNQGLSTERLIKLFDFEEAKLGNYEDLPQHWYIIGRPSNSPDPNFANIPLHQEAVSRGGYPHFTRVSFDRPQHEAGPHSFVMKLDGGNIGAFLEVGAIPAIPLSEYQMTVRVRTEGLVKSGARLTAYLIDNEGKRIDASIARSPIVRSQDKWQTLSVPLSAEFANAAWIGIELEVLQPTLDPDSPLGNEQIVIEDIHGLVWWDNLAIWQMPQVSVQTQSSVNIVHDPHEPEMTVRVRDVSGNALLADLIIYDVAGQVVDQIQRTSGDGNSELWHWSPKLPRYGWYMADLSVYDTQQQGETLLPGAIAHTLSAFLWLPEEQPLYPLDAKRFMLLGDGTSVEQLKHLPELLKLSGVEVISLSLWDPMTSRATMEKRLRILDEVINPILANSSHVSLSMSPGPREMLTQMDLHDSSVMEMYAYPREQWLEYLLPILLRHGQAVSQWQLGALATPLDPADPDLITHVLTADRALKTMAPDPELVLPWSIHYPPVSGMSQPLTWMLDVPPAARAESLGNYLESWKKYPQYQAWLALREPPAIEMSREDRLTDLTLRMIHGWEAEAAGLALDHPWAWATTRQKALMPDALLGAFAQVSRRLAGRRAVGRLTIAPGLECVIFDGPTGGMLAMWNASAENDQVAMYLGQSPVARDIWGNSTPLALIGGVHHLRVPRTPIFIEGIDARLAVMRAGFKLDDPFIESTQTPHRRVLTINNPWPRTITGSMQIVGPQGWRISPAQTRFSIASGGSMELPLEMIFPISEIGGHKQLDVRMTFQAEQAYDAHFHAPLELGLKNITFDANISYVRNERTRAIDGIVTQFITNTGSEPVSLYAFAQTPGFPRQEGIISRLKAGESIIRRFRFEDVAKTPALDQTLRVGLRETRGPAVLNEKLTFKPPIVPNE